MTGVTALFSGKTNRICRLFSNGWDPNLAAWTEEIQENFAEICEHFGDNAAECQLRGEAKWMWIRFSKSRIARIEETEFDGAEKVTMIRVHRKRGRRG